MRPSAATLASPSGSGDAVSRSGAAAEVPTDTRHRSKPPPRSDEKTSDGPSALHAGSRSHAGPEVTRTHRAVAPARSCAQTSPRTLTASRPSCEYAGSRTPDAGRESAAAGAGDAEGCAPMAPRTMVIDRASSTAAGSVAGDFGIGTVTDSRSCPARNATIGRRAPGRRSPDRIAGSWRTEEQGGPPGPRLVPAQTGQPRQCPHANRLIRRAGAARRRTYDERTGVAPGCGTASVLAPARAVEPGHLWPGIGVRGAVAAPSGWLSAAGGRA